jgi:hypothetical protein
LPTVLANLLEERVGQLEDVFEALAQRRQRDLEHAKPVIQILAELAALHRGSEITVGRRDHTNVRVQDPRAAEPHELALLEHAKQLRLTVGIISPTSSRNSTPPLACSMRPGLAATAPVNAPARDRTAPIRAADRAAPHS